MLSPLTPAPLPPGERGDLCGNRPSGNRRGLEIEQETRRGGNALAAIHARGNGGADAAQRDSRWLQHGNADPRRGERQRGGVRALVGDRSRRRVRRVSDGCGGSRTGSSRYSAYVVSPAPCRVASASAGAATARLERAGPVHAAADATARLGG